MSTASFKKDNTLIIIRRRLCTLVKDSERDDFKLYIEEANLEPIFRTFLNDSLDDLKLHQVVIDQMAQHALGKLRHAFDLDIINGGRDLKMRLQYGENDHRTFRDTHPSREIAQTLIGQQHRNIEELNKILDNEEEAVGPCVPPYTSK